MITYYDAICAIIGKDKLVYGPVDGPLSEMRFESSVTLPSEEQIQAKLTELKAAEPLRQLREQRNQLLAATDWWVLPDRTATAEQLAYRQAFRDLPANSTPALDENGNLTGITWPTPPND